MSQVGHNDSQFGGRYLIQDSDHMSEIFAKAERAQRGSVRQAEQSHSRTRQQGAGEDHASGQQGGERVRKSR